LYFAVQLLSTLSVFKITSVDPELEEQVQLSVDGELSGREDKGQGQVENEGGVGLRQ
jgi:hypothetical protein